MRHQVNYSLAVDYTPATAFVSKHIVIYLNKCNSHGMVTVHNSDKEREGCEEVKAMRTGTYFTLCYLHFLEAVDGIV